MGLLEIIAVILGSSAVTAAVTAFFARPQTKANAVKTNIEAAGDLSEHSIDLVKALEGRLRNQDQKLELLERQILVFLSAISCAYQCAHASKCPVLDYLNKNPINKRNHEENNNMD